MTPFTVAEPYYLIMHNSSRKKDDIVRFRVVSVYPERQPPPPYPITPLMEYPVADVLVNRENTSEKFKVVIERRMYDPIEILGGASDPSKASKALEAYFEAFKAERAAKEEKATDINWTYDAQGSFITRIAARIGDDWHQWKLTEIDLLGKQGYLYYTSDGPSG